MATILLADADPNARSVLAAALAEAGYETFESRNRNSVLATFAKRTVDLVVLDFMLADEPGAEICRELRARDPANDTPILFLSASAASSWYLQAIAAGADDFLTKPIHKGELLLRIRSLLCLRDTRRELTQANAQLIAQHDALLKAQAQKQELMAFIVHDLKNPLAAIAANASFVSYAKEMTAAVRGAAEGAERAADDMLRMVHNLLDVARAEDAGLAPHLEPIDLRGLVSATTQLLEKRASERGLSLHAALPAESLTVRGDADLLRRLLENLLDNALRYSPRGGVVRVTAEAVGDHVSLRVSDQGPGIAPELRERIFDKYVQLERPADHAQKRFGRGLGLSFAKLAAEAHGGRISVEEALPTGTTFHVSLPSTSRSPVTSTDPA